MALSFGIGAVKKKSTARSKKTTASKTKRKTTTKAKSRGAKPTAGSKVSASGKRYYPSTPAKKKSYKATKTCSAAGGKLKATGDSAAGAILALCKANVLKKNIKPSVLKKYGVRKVSLSRKKG